MAMSSLQAQLASLNSQGTPGLSYGTSKRHEDAVGRGLTHSVQHGHSVTTSDPKFKPSILYANAKSASDVPLTTLRENSLIVMEQLSQNHNESFYQYTEPLFGVSSLSLERGLSTKVLNEQRYKLIGELLFLLGTTSMEESEGLVVMEYLVRRHDIHVTCADAVLTSMLAHHEKPFFSRLLQLIDLASSPTWSFLRPYAAPQAPPVPRRVIAKRASKAPLLLKLACDIAEHSATNGGGMGISFGAAIVVEGLTMQATATGTIDEAGLRVVLPHCIRACSGGGKTTVNNEDWRGFGYVVASCIAEHAVLTVDVADGLASSIVKGLTMYTDEKNLEQVADGIATVMVVLSSLPRDDSKKTNTTMLRIGHRSNKTATEPEYMGYTLPPKTFSRLAKLPFLGAALGLLHEQRGYVVAHLLSSLVVVDLSNATKLVLNLIQHSTIKPVWKDPQYNLIASFTYHLIQKTIQSNDVTVTESARSILDALRTIDSSACDLGITQAVTRKKHSKATKTRLAQLLLGQTDDTNRSDEGTATAALLPPLVALEHADSTVRLAAISKLIANGGGDGVEVALLRHVTMEDNMEIVLASGRAVESILKNDNRKSAGLASTILAVLQHWALDDRAEEPGTIEGAMKGRWEVVGIALSLAAHAVKALLEKDIDDETLTFLIQGIVAHLSSDNIGIASNAAMAMCFAFQKNAKSADAMKLTKDLIFSGEKVKNAVMYSSPSTSTTASSLHRRSQLVFADVVAEKLQSKSKGKREAAEVGFGCCLSVLRITKEIKKQEGIRLLSCIRRSVELLPLHELFAGLRFLLSIESKNTFNRVASEAILSICSTVAKIISPVSLLMEIASCEDCPVVALKRVLQRVTDLVTANPKESALAIVPTLALLAHTDQDIRKNAAALLCNLEPKLNNDAKVFTSVGKLMSSIQLNGASALPAYFREAIKESQHPEKSRTFLLDSCVNLLANETLSNLGAVAGSLRSCSIVLSAIEFAGESVFPLIERWAMAGTKISAMFMTASKPTLYAEGPTDAIVQVLGRMLKGGTVVDSSSLDMDIIISTGPSFRGTRTRSYSVGRTKGVALLHPYPADMVTTIIKCFDKGSAVNSTPIVRYMCRTFLHDVVGRQSWSNGIFKKLSPTSRTQLAFALISLRASGSIDMDASAFLSLPLDIADVCSLVDNGIKDSMNLVAITSTMDYVRANALRLSVQNNASQLIASLFDTLGGLSTFLFAHSDDDVEFTAHSVLLALSQFLMRETEHPSLVPKDRVSFYTTLLVALLRNVNNENKKETIAFKSWKTKSTALELLARMCRYHPKTVVPMLIHALISSTITNRLAKMPETPSDVVLRTTRDTYVSMVPVIIEFSSEAGLSIFDLFGTFLGELNSVQDEVIKNVLCAGMVDALLLHSPLMTKSHLGLFLSCLLANEITLSSSKLSAATPRHLILSLLQKAPVKAQMEAIKEFIAVASAALSIVLDEEVDSDHKVALESIQIMTRSNPLSTMASSASFANTVCGLVLETLNFPLVERFVKQGSGSDSSLSLEIWQDLLLLQTSAVDLERKCFTNSIEVKTNSIKIVDKSLAASLKTVVDDSLATLQKMLPAHIFLASVNCIIDDSSSAELKSKALRFVAERASIVAPDSLEASLFLDIIPSLVSLFDSFESDASIDGLIVQQAVVVAIEQIARCLVLPNGDSKNAGTFSQAMKSISKQLDHFSASEAFLETDAVCQLVCSMALGIATLVKTLKARCLPFLPKLISSFLLFLSKANQSASDSSSSMNLLDHAKLIQLSSIRAFVGMAESVPQFLIPYLNRLFTPAILSSRSIKRSANGETVVNILDTMVGQLDGALATNIPCRQLVPSACKALSTCQHVEEFITILAIIRRSMDHAPQGDLASVRNYVVKGILLVYDFNAISIEEKKHLLDSVNGVALALVMKLSEVQLFDLFAKVREWRDDDMEKASERQYAFWSMTAILSKELRSIFFNCMSTVVADAVRELDVAASILDPKKQAIKLAGGTKKQKLNDKMTTNHDVDKNALVRYVEPLLLCLEYTLKADAHDGGQWIRADDNSRYHSLLGPLTKLLQSEQSLPGAISCITSLACAAGNEQLWKPLNHGVLVACSNERQSNVRNSGIRCLLSLIQALGEEYMVLLPECLPVLSELLEDSDEDTAGIAQECVSLSEDLLGESLQDSLR